MVICREYVSIAQNVKANQLSAKVIIFSYLRQDLINEH